MSEDCHESNNGRAAGYPPEHTCRFSTGPCPACEYFAPVRRQTHNARPVSSERLLKSMGAESGKLSLTASDEEFLAGCKIKV